MNIVNLTQHKATPEQCAEGVFDLSDEPADELIALLTFAEPPPRDEIINRAAKIARVARATGAEAAMLGGALWLMSALEQQLRLLGIGPLYAFSIRESAEVPQPDGTLRKVSIFRHAGWVRP